KARRLLEMATHELACGKDVVDVAKELGVVVAETANGENSRTAELSSAGERLADHRGAVGGNYLFGRIIIGPVFRDLLQKELQVLCLFGRIWYGLIMRAREQHRHGHAIKSKADDSPLIRPPFATYTLLALALMIPMQSHIQAGKVFFDRKQR